MWLDQAHSTDSMLRKVDKECFPCLCSYVSVEPSCVYVCMCVVLCIDIDN